MKYLKRTFESFKRPSRLKRMAARFFGKVVLITGGNSGIGRACARAFATEGAQVIITGRDRESLRRAASEVGNNTTAHCCDTRSVDQIAYLATQLKNAPGRIDVLFINAGVLSLGPIESVSEAQWHLVHDTNLKGAFFTVQAVLPLMPDGSAIVLTGSTAGSKGVPGAAIYAASKAGIRSLAYSLAGELLHRRIRVNVLSPGPTDTPIFQRVEGLTPNAISTVRREESECVPMKRLGTVEEVASAVLFLAGPEATFITATELFVDGGVRNL